MGGRGRRGGILPSAATYERLDQFSHNLKAGSPVPSLSWLAPLYFPSKVQGPLSRVLQKSRVEASSDGLKTSWSVLQSATGGRGKWKEGN